MYSVLAGASAAVVNPDEMETQLYLLPGQIPSCGAPSCLQEVLTYLVAAPPSLDPTMQYKRNFKPLVSTKKSRLGEPVELRGLWFLIFHAAHIERK